MHEELVFGHDIILDTPSTSDLKDIWRHKQELIDKITKTRIKIEKRATIDYVRKY